MLATKLAPAESPVGIATTETVLFSEEIARAVRREIERVMAAKKFKDSDEITSSLIYQGFVTAAREWFEAHASEHGNDNDWPLAAIVDLARNYTDEVATYRTFWSGHLEGPEIVDITTAYFSLGKANKLAELTTDPKPIATARTRMLAILGGKSKAVYHRPVRVVPLSKQAAHPIPTPPIAQPAPLLPAPVEPIPDTMNALLAVVVEAVVAPDQHSETITNVITHSTTLPPPPWDPSVATPTLEEPLVASPHLTIESLPIQTTDGNLMALETTVEHPKPSPLAWIKRTRALRDSGPTWSRKHATVDLNFTRAVDAAVAQARSTATDGDQPWIDAALEETHELAKTHYKGMQHGAVLPAIEILGHQGDVFRLIYEELQGYHTLFSDLCSDELAVQDVQAMMTAVSPHFAPTALGDISTLKKLSRAQLKKLSKHPDTFLESIRERCSPQTKIPELIESVPTEVIKDPAPAAVVSVKKPAAVVRMEIPETITDTVDTYMAAIRSVDASIRTRALAAAKLVQAERHQIEHALNVLFLENTHHLSKETLNRARREVEVAATEMIKTAYVARAEGVAVPMISTKTLVMQLWAEVVACYEILKGLPDASSADKPKVLTISRMLVTDLGSEDIAALLLDCQRVAPERTVQILCDAIRYYPKTLAWLEARLTSLHTPKAELASPAPSRTNEPPITAITFTVEASNTGSLAAVYIPMLQDLLFDGYLKAESPMLPEAALGNIGELVEQHFPDLENELKPQLMLLVNNLVATFTCLMRTTRKRIAARDRKLPNELQEHAWPQQDIPLSELACYFLNEITQYFVIMRAAATTCKAPDTNDKNLVEMIIRLLPFISSRELNEQLAQCTHRPCLSTLLDLIAKEIEQLTMTVHDFSDSTHVADTEEFSENDAIVNNSDEPTDAELLRIEDEPEENNEPLQLEDPKAPLSIEQICIQRIFRYAVATNDENRANLTHYRRNGSLYAFNQVLRGNARLVIKNARKYYYVAPFVDLVCAGNQGLIRAAQKFDIGRGYKFSTYATHWIRTYISRYMKECGRPVRLPAHIITDGLKAVRILQRHRQQGHENPIAATATDMTSSVADVEELLQTIGTKAVSTDAPIHHNDDRSVGETLAGSALSPEEACATNQEKTAVHNMLEKITLTDMQRDILRRRGFVGEEPEQTLKEIGKRYGVTRERIRQLEARALKRIRRDVGSKYVPPKQNTKATKGKKAPKVTDTNEYDDELE